MKSVRWFLYGIAASGLTACSSGDADRGLAVSAWAESRSAELPVSVGDFDWTELSLYENQVIAIYRRGTSASQSELDEERAFRLVRAQVCGVTGVDVVWESDFEHYTQLKTAGDDVLYTVQTKAFDCCVAEAEKTMSTREAQNRCPYEE